MHCPEMPGLGPRRTNYRLDPRLALPDFSDQIDRWLLNEDLDVGDDDLPVVDENEVRGSGSHWIENDRTVVAFVNIDDIRIADQDRFKGPVQHQCRFDAQPEGDNLIRRPAGRDRGQQQRRPEGEGAKNWGHRKSSDASANCAARGPIYRALGRKYRRQAGVTGAEITIRFL